MDGRLILPARRDKATWVLLGSLALVAASAGLREAQPLIAIHYRPDYTADAGGRAFARALSGLEGGIPDLYARRLDELLPLLRGFLQVHREDHGG